MEYSKNIALNPNYNDVNILRKKIKRTSKLKFKYKESKAFKFITIISIVCIFLIFVDVLLIYNFANTLQNMI